jgi:hypothetical protein
LNLLIDNHFSFNAKNIIALIIIYILLAPIYWLPNIPVSLIKVVKVIIIFTAFIGYFIFLLSKNLKLAYVPIPILLPTLITAIFYFPFFIISFSEGRSFSEFTLYYLNFFFGFLTSILAFNNYNLICTAQKWFKIIFLIMSFLCLFPVLNFFTGKPDIISPYAIQSNLIDLDFFWSTGYNASRTGWSGTLIPFIPLGLIFFNKENIRDKPGLSLLLFFITISLILGAQVISLGRGGMLGSFICIIILMSIYFPSRYFLYLFLIILIIFLSFKNEILLALRFADMEGSGVSLGEASSVRFDQYVLAPQFIFEKPLFGHGFRGSESALFNVGGEKFEGFEIHNSFLLLFVDNGIVVGMTFLLFASYMIVCALRVIFDKSAPIALHVFSSIIIGGLASSLFEPHAIFTNFQHMPMWWLSAGMILSYLQKNQNKDVRNFRNL